MSTLDSYYGQMEGRYVCEGCVSATPSGALDAARERLDEEDVKVTAHALASMSAEQLRALRDRAMHLGIYLREEERA